MSLLLLRHRRGRGRGGTRGRKGSKNKNSNNNSRKRRRTFKAPGPANHLPPCHPVLCILFSQLCPLSLPPWISSVFLWSSHLAALTWASFNRHVHDPSSPIGAPDQTCPGGVTAYLSFLQEVFVTDRYSDKLVLKDLNPKAKYCFQAQVTITLQAKSSARGLVTCVTMLKHVSNKYIADFCVP